MLAQGRMIHKTTMRSATTRAGKSLMAGIRYARDISLPVILIILIFYFAASGVQAQESPAVHLAAFGGGDGPVKAAGVFHLLDKAHSPEQSNAVGFDVVEEGAFEQLRLDCKFRVLAGGDGGSFIFLNTAEYGRRGPAPYVRSWVEPNLAKTFAIGIDVHNPPSSDPYDEWGNYYGLPEREISLHWDGREIVKRVSPAEFRESFTGLAVIVQQVTGGAEVTVTVADSKVYDRYFLAGMMPYEARLAIGAGTRADAVTEFDVKNIALTKEIPSSPERRPAHFEIFNHVMLNNATPVREKDISLPPGIFAYGRVILTLDIHDAGPDWDKWDRYGSLYIVRANGEKYDILPFVTSFRTPGRWAVDVSRFRPWLAGPVKFALEAGRDFEKNKGFMLSVGLDFHHGTPEFEPYRVIPLWVGTARYGSAENHFGDFFAPQAEMIDAQTTAAELFITATGHSPVGEFTPSGRTVTFVPERGGDPANEKRFANTLWKSDNYLNPVRPQSGTWKFSRAGWAPGDIVHPWLIDLTPYIMPGRTAELRYEPAPYDFSEKPEDKRPNPEEVSRAIQVVRAYLLLYRSPVNMVETPPFKVLEVLEDSNALEAGILPGDYLETYDRRRFDSIDALRRATREAEAAGRQNIRIVLYRGPERIEKEIGPGQMGVLLEEQ